jgi:ribosomal-protein-alanine N-acetyltransferase
LIREFRQSDLDTILNIENQPGMLRFENGITGRDNAQRYLERAIQEARQSPRNHFHLAITLPVDGEVIGRISLTSQNSDIREWEIGWAIRTEDWGKGYAAEVALRLLAFAFDELNAHRVVAFCHADNLQSIRVMDKIGMRREGLLRQTRWFKESWADECVYAILESDFAKTHL